MKPQFFRPPVGPEPCLSCYQGHFCLLPVGHTGDHKEEDWGWWAGSDEDEARNVERSRLRILLRRAEMVWRTGEKGLDNLEVRRTVLHMLRG